jgi:hypothetical protein
VFEKRGGAEERKESSLLGVSVFGRMRKKGDDILDEDTRGWQRGEVSKGSNTWAEAGMHLGNK